MMQTMTRGNESSAATGDLLVAFELSQRPLPRRRRDEAPQRRSKTFDAHTTVNGQAVEDVVGVKQQELSFCHRPTKCESTLGQAPGNGRPMRTGRQHDHLFANGQAFGDERRHTARKEIVGPIKADDVVSLLRG
jgi:hypothetical protein